MAGDWNNLWFIQHSTITSRWLMNSGIDDALTYPMSWRTHCGCMNHNSALTELDHHQFITGGKRSHQSQSKLTIVCKWITTVQIIQPGQLALTLSSQSSFGAIWAKTPVIQWAKLSSVKDFRVSPSPTFQQYIKINFCGYNNAALS